MLNDWVRVHIKSLTRWYYPDKVQAERDLSKFLLFIPRDIAQESQYAITKYILLKNYQKSHLYQGNTFLDFYLYYLGDNFVGNNCVFNPQRILTNTFGIIQKKNLQICELGSNDKKDFIQEFLKNTDILFVDSNLYKRYAKNFNLNLNLTEEVLGALVDYKVKL